MITTCVQFIKDIYPIISLLALLAIVGLLVCSLLCKKKSDFTIGIRNELMIWVALLCSLIALCRAYPTTLNFDYMGIIVGILSLLVTVLLGWNIFSVIDVKNIRQDYEKLKAEMETEKKRLRGYVDIVQNFTMANVRMTESKYGDALGIYCNAAISLYALIKDDETKWNEENDEIDLMCKCIENAYNIVATNKDIKNSPVLADMYSYTIQGLKDMSYNKMNNVKKREWLNEETQELITAIEKNYSSK